MKRMLNIALAICSIALVGCEGKDYVTSFYMEQDGDVSLIAFHEYEGTVTNPMITLESMNQPRQYPTDLPAISEKYQDILDAHNELIAENNGEVDITRYQYVFSIPIKSDKNIFGLPTDFDASQRNSFMAKRCNASYPYEALISPFNLSADYTQGESGLYHYNLYIVAGRLASDLMLNKVQDMCIRYTYYSGGGYTSDHYKTTSNTLVVAADEIKSALSAKGISHE